MHRLLLLLTASLLLTACGGATGEPPPQDAERLEKAGSAENVAERESAPAHR